jgi:hypothetical protein
MLQIRLSHCITRFRSITKPTDEKAGFDVENADERGHRHGSSPWSLDRHEVAAPILKSQRLHEPPFYFLQVPGLAQLGLASVSIRLLDVDPIVVLSHLPLVEWLCRGEGDRYHLRG